jgi:hypothetical protein
MFSDKSPTVVAFCAFGVTRLSVPEESLLKAFCVSVREAYKTNPIKIILITDEVLDEASLEGLFDEWVRAPVIREELLLSRAKAYLDLVQRFHWETPLLLLDYDILLLKKLDQLFTSEYDVFLTYRDYMKGMPINGGVVMLNNIRPAACVRFYERVVQAYIDLPKNVLQWWGDQMSLSKVALDGAFAETLGQPAILTPDGIRLRLLSRDFYNFTPYDVDSGSAIPDIVDEKTKEHILNNVAIAHFKGPRKHLMLDILRSITTHRAAG